MPKSTTIATIAIEPFVRGAHDPGIGDGREEIWSNADARRDQGPQMLAGPESERQVDKAARIAT